LPSLPHLKGAKFYQSWLDLNQIPHPQDSYARKFDNLETDMESNSRGKRQVRYRAGEAVRTAGPATAGGTAPGRRHTLQRIHSGWRRRMGATGLLLAVIAVTAALAG
jgi:hypothetical protein